MVGTLELGQKSRYLPPLSRYSISTKVIIDFSTWNLMFFASHDTFISRNNKTQRREISSVHSSPFVYLWCRLVAHS